MPNILVSRLLIPIIAAVGLGASVALTTLMPEPAASIALEPAYNTPMVGESFTVEVNVRSEVSVNAFRGLFRYDESKLQIEQIDYNTSIADIWVKEPWYSNGDGTFSFAGGTTMRNGFIGEGTLITIRFKSIAAGDAPVTVEQLQILKHDGLGTDVTDIENSIDGLFAIAPEQLAEKVVNPDIPTAKREARVIPLGRSPDLNGDGNITVIDVSIFMQKLSTRDTEADFNGDGSVNTKDLSIILREL